MKPKSRSEAFEEYCIGLGIDLFPDHLAYFKRLVPKLTEEELGNFFVSGMEEESLFLLGKGYGEKYQVEIPASIEERLLELQPLPVRVTVDEAMKEKIIPIPWEYWKNREYLFPHSFTRREVIVQDIKKTGEKVVIIKRKVGSKIITYKTFISEGVSEKDQPKFGKMTDNLYKALVWSQKTQHHKSGFPAWTYVKLTDLLKLCDYTADEAKGKTFALAKNSLQTLSSTIYEIKDEKTGKVLEKENIINYKSSLKGQGFSYILNKDHLRLLTALSMGERGIKYVGYDTRLQLEGRKMGRQKKKIFEYLQELKGLPRRYPVSIKKIMVQVAGYKLKDVKEMQTQGRLSGILSPILEEAKERGFIAGYEYKSNGSKDLLDWKVQFTMQRKRRSHPVDLDLVEEIVTMLSEPLFEDDEKIKNRKRYVTSSMKKYGVQDIKNAFANSNSPEEFWKAVKALNN